MKKLLSLLVAAFVTFSLSAQTTKTMVWGDSTRQYIEYVPTSYNASTPAPVLFALHGLGGTMNDFDGTGLRRIADEHGWILVTPQALECVASLMGQSMSIGTAWNSGINAQYSILTIPVNSHIDDAGFFLAILDDLIANYNIDQRNVFFTGFSMGGFMSNRMAIEHGDRIRAIASVSGTIGNAIQSQTPVAPTNALHIHGTADETVSYADASMSMQGMALNLGIGAEQTVEFWRSFNHCGETPEITSYPDNVSDGLTFEKRTYTGGTDGTKVAFIKVEGGDHDWYYTPANDIDYATEIYVFFASCMEGVGIQENRQAELSLFPNPASSVLNIVGENVEYTEIYSANGQLMLTSSESVIPVSSLSEGMYIARIISKDGSAVNRNLLIAR